MGMVSIRESFVLSAKVRMSIGFSLNNSHNDDVTDGDNDGISEPI